MYRNTDSSIHSDEITRGRVLRKLPSYVCSSVRVWTTNGTRCRSGVCPTPVRVRRRYISFGAAVDWFANDPFDIRRPFFPATTVTWAPSYRAEQKVSRRSRNRPSRTAIRIRNRLRTSFSYRQYGPPFRSAAGTSDSGSPAFVNTNTANERCSVMTGRSSSRTTMSTYNLRSFYERPGKELAASNREKRKIGRVTVVRTGAVRLHRPKGKIKYENYFSPSRA